MTFFVWSAHSAELQGDDLLVPATILTVVVALLMVSNFRYPSFKQAPLSERVPFATLLIAVGLIVVVAINPPVVLFVTSFIYAMSAPAAALWRWYKRRRRTVADEDG